MDEVSLILGRFGAVCRCQPDDICLVSFQLLPHSACSDAPSDRGRSRSLTDLRQQQTQWFSLPGLQEHCETQSNHAIVIRQH